MHTRCCSLYFASCFAFPWDISGESVAHTAVRDSHVLAAAPPEVPAAVCTGCFLRMAEASSSPSDPLDLKAAKQVGTHDVHPATYRNCSRPPKNPPEENLNKLVRRSRRQPAPPQVLRPTVASRSAAWFLLPFQTHRHFAKNKPNEKSFYADKSPVARGQKKGGKDH